MFEPAGVQEKGVGSFFLEFAELNPSTLWLTSVHTLVVWPLESKACSQQKVATYFFQGFAGSWEPLLDLVVGGLHIAVEICVFWQAHFQVFIVLLLCWKNREPSTVL